MTRRCKIVIFAGCGLIAVALICFFSLRQSEPSYNGFPLSHWVEILGGANGDTLLAEKAIRTIGPQAVPHLLIWLQHKHSISDDFSDAVKELLLKRQRKLSARRFNGVQPAFAVLGSSAQSAVPALASLAKSDLPIAGRAIVALANVGPDGVTALAFALQDTENPNHLAVMNAILSHPVVTSSFMPMAVRWLRASDHELMLNASVLLEEGPETDLAVTTFTNALQSSNADLRTIAIGRLAKFRNIPGVLVYFTNALADPDLGVRYTATNILHHIALQDQATNARVRR